MAKCHECGDTDVYASENNPNVLISKHTGEGHKCDPGNKRVQDGIWRGWKFKEMARMVASRNKWTKEDLDRIKRESSPDG